jgi:hypothetical protein
VTAQWRLAAASGGGRWHDIRWLAGRGARQEATTMSPEALSPFFEMLMLISFGIAWPTAILKSIRSKSAKGKSPVFMVYIWFGYLFGVIAHLVTNTINYPLFFYLLNMAMVLTDFGLYWRNRRYDQLAELKAVEKTGD